MEGKNLPNCLNGDTLDLRGVTIKKEYSANPNNTVLKDCDIKLECTHDQQPCSVAVKQEKDDEDSSKAEDSLEIRKEKQSKSPVMKTLKVILEKVDKPVQKETGLVPMSMQVKKTKKQLESSEFMAAVNSLKYHSRVVLERVDVQLTKNTSDKGNFRSKAHNQGRRNGANAVQSIGMNPKVALEKLDHQTWSDTSNVAGKRTFKIGYDKQNIARSYACSECPSKFKQFGYLKRHLMSHGEERPYACSQCPSKFNRSDSLKYHMISHTCERPYACTHCPSKFKLSQNLESHLMLHTGERLFSCMDCPAAYNNIHYFKIHLESNPNHKPSKGRIFLCTYCSKRFVSLKAVNIHKRIHSGEKPFVCSQCPAKFADKTCLRIHKKTHTKEKPYGCAHCHEKFQVKSTLINHLFEHSAQKNYTCPHCPANFALRGHLIKHFRTHTKVTRKVSSTKFIEDDLIVDEKTHLERPFACSLCPAKFISKSILYIHFRQHTGALNFTCSVCGGKFATKTALGAHSRSHTDGKPNRCSLCPAKFRQGPGLMSHMKTHKNWEPFTCAHCSRTFVRKASLKSHIKKHFAKLTFACSKCPKKFSKEKDLDLHVSARHNCLKYSSSSDRPAPLIWKKALNEHFKKIQPHIKPFACSYCPEKCSHKSNLTRHIRKYHGKKPFAEGDS